MLPEPISVTAAVLSIAGSAYKISKDIYDLIQGIRGAPTHITRLSKDIHGLYGVLGTLQHLLGEDAKKKAGSALIDTLIVDLEDLLRNCVEVLKDIQKILAPFKSDSSTHTAWKGFKWEIFKKNDVAGLQVTLSSYKLSLNIACQALLISTTSSTHNIVQQIQKDVQQLKYQADSREGEASTGQRRNGGNAAADDGGGGGGGGDGDDDNDDPANHHKERPAAHRLSTASSDLSIRRFLVEAENLASSLAGDSRPPTVVSTASLCLDENPQNDFSGDDNAANDCFNMRAGFDAPQRFDESLTEEDNNLAPSQLVEPRSSMCLNPPAADTVILRLRTHVVDWKGIDLKTLGELLLHGNLRTLRKGNKGTHHYYLFERVLLGVKETLPLVPDQNEGLLLPVEERAALQESGERNVQPVMKLKGKIFFKDIIAIASSGSSTLSEYTLRIGYLSSPGLSGEESHWIGFSNYATMCLWQDTLRGAWNKVMENTPPSRWKAKNPI